MPEPEESIAVDNSASTMEETPIETPSEPAAPETPAEKVETAQPAEPVAELFELPDGRKVDAVTLTKEWRENFLPDYTRKSQDLAKLKTEILPDKQPKESPYADPNYIPQSYDEIIKAAKDEALKEWDARKEAEVEHSRAIESEVVNQLNEIKKSDSTLNENALFLHATKYGFRDLKLAHQNMKDMSDVVKKTQETTVKNIAKRNDPVSISPGASGAKLNPDDFGSAKEYLRALKGTG